MSLGTLVYLGGMAALYVGQRLLDGHDGPQWVLSLAGLAAIVAAAVLRARRMKRSNDDGVRFGNRVALMFLLVGAASLVLYAATTNTVVRGMTLGQDAEDRWLGVWRSLWPVVWLLGTVPLLVVDWAIESSPVTMPRRRVRDLTAHGVVAALGIALVFPVNYIANQRKERWDLAYFKTPAPGTATLAVAQALEEKVHVRIFMPPSSEVAEELRNYFRELEGPNLVVEVIDQAAEPRLAKALSVRDNGTVAFTQGDLVLDEPESPQEETDGEATKPKPITRTLRVDPDFDKAKRTLSKLDREVQRILIELGHGERVAYVTSGHGELQWEGRAPLDASLKAVKSRLSELGFTVKRLGIDNWLADNVPDDADVVMVVGPQGPFAPAEVDALRRYVQGGGSLLVALEPASLRPPMQGTDPLEELVAELGLRLGDGVLATERSFIKMTNNKLDQLNITTNAFTSHPAIATLAEQSRSLILFFFAAGHLEETGDHANKVSMVVRSPAVTWADLGQPNAEYEPDNGESKAARNLVAAVEGGEEGARWRAIVSADSTIFADLTHVEHPSFGNGQLVDDVMNWLIGAEALSGTTESEEDVKIEHTKEGQTTWFYLTVLAVPLGLMGAGAARVRMRHHARARSQEPAPAGASEPETGGPKASTPDRNEEVER